MHENWFYVEGKERVGPISREEMLQMIDSGKLNSEYYVWKKGFDNWQKLIDVPELSLATEADKTREITLPNFSADESQQSKEDSDKSSFSWSHINENDSVFTIKVGLDRSGDTTEYGPYSIKLMTELFKQNRINEKTYVFTPGMDEWTFLGDLPIYSQHFSSKPPVINEEDRRSHVRKPFVARMLFHDTNVVFEGVCRDISVGGMQVLVKGFPGRQGENISVNVHPDNSSFHFSADAEVVRILDGGQGISFRFKNLSPDARMTIEKFISTDMQ